MIRVKQDGEERQLSYEQFIREIQEGRVTRETLVSSDVLTSGVWKPAGQLQFFRSWAPPGSLPSAEERVTPSPGEAETRPAVQPSEASVPPPSPETPWVPYGHGTEAGEPPARPEPWGSGTAAEPSAAAFPANPLPWEEMDRIGFFRGLTRTIGMAFGKSDEFIRGIGCGEAVMPALVFGILIFALCSLVQCGYDVLTMRSFSEMLAKMQSEVPGLFQEGAQPSLRATIYLRGLMVLLYPLGVLLLSGLIHLLLRLFGRPVRSFKTSFRVMNYATVPLLLVVVPVCGYLVGLIWAVVLMIRGLARLHGVGAFSAAAAVLAPALLFCAWMIIAVAGYVARILPHMGGV